MTYWLLETANTTWLTETHTLVSNKLQAKQFKSKLAAQIYAVDRHFATFLKPTEHEFKYDLNDEAQNYLNLSE